MLEYIDMNNQLDTSEVELMSHVLTFTMCSARMSWKMEMNQMRCFRMHRSRKKNSTRVPRTVSKELEIGQYGGNQGWGILELTALELGKEIKEKRISVREAVQASLERIHKYEDTVHAYVTLTEEAALAQADEIQKQIDDGILTGPLAGVPMAIKDNICTEGIETTCSSKILRGFVSVLQRRQR